MLLRQAVRNLTKKRKPIKRGAMRPLSTRPQGTHIVGQSSPKPQSQFSLQQRYDTNPINTNRRHRRYV